MCTGLYHSSRLSNWLNEDICIFGGMRWYILAWCRGAYRKISIGCAGTSHLLRWVRWYTSQQISTVFIIYSWGFPKKLVLSVSILPPQVPVYYIIKKNTQKKFFLFHQSIEQCLKLLHQCFGSSRFEVID